jgi:hypothetical protein
MLTVKKMSKRKAKNTMGLREKRLAEEIKTTKAVEVKQNIDEMCGAPIELDIDWESFTAYDEYPLTRLRDSFFRDLLETIRLITKDEMGKEAFVARVKRLSVVCTDDPQKSGVELKEAETLTYIAQLAGNNFSFPTPPKTVKYLEDNL